MAESKEIELKRGLRDVYLDRTEASFIDGSLGRLQYRGYNIDDLAKQSNFEEVMYLLLYGTLPKIAELDEFNALLVKSRPVPTEILGIIDVVKTLEPMDVLRTAISALAAFDSEVGDNSAEAVLRKGVRIAAQAPTIVAAHHRIRNGMEPIPPNGNLNHAGNFLYMLRGTEPPPDEATILDVDFILHAEHGSNASAFAARVTASTQSDLYSAIVTGIATLKGPWHGGAAERVMEVAEEIGHPDNAAAYASKVLGSGGRIMGFGHRVYKAEDPRAQHLKERARDLGEKYGDPKWFQILSALGDAMEPYRRRGVFANVDYYAGVIYRLMSIPEDLYVPIFALGRIAGWVLQVQEQYANNILIRPLTLYTGPMDLDYCPIAQR